MLKCIFNIIFLIRVVSNEYTIIVNKINKSFLFQWEGAVSLSTY